MSARADDAAAIARGAYLFAASGCGPCHTDAASGGAPLAGGRALKTRFGTFITPNISPDRRDGIGNWTDADFLRAMRKGVSPGGVDYYPAFPYPAFTMMTDPDILAIKAYLFSQPAVAQPNRPHDLSLPYSMRMLLTPWKILYFREGQLLPDPAHTAEWNRGAYLARAVADCGGCHTPRNWAGAIDKHRRLAGAADASGGPAAPDITPDPAALGRWSTEDLAQLLKNGVTPTGDVVRQGMAEAVRGTAMLSDEDRNDIAVYIKSMPPIPPLPR